MANGLLAILLLLLSFPAAAQDRNLDTIAARELPATGAPGASWAAIEGNTVDAGARGVLRQGGNERVDENTPFPIGSITKSFTAVAILQLVEVGTLDLDDMIGGHLAISEGHALSAVTIRQLLSHTSGLSTVQGNLPHADDIAANARFAQFLQREPAHAPGSRFEYSNSNYFLLGAIIEAASRERYDDYLVRNVLAPIGIDYSNRVRAATPHRPWFGSKRTFNSGEVPVDISPAGGLVLSARELAAYLIVLMNGRDDVITAAHKAQMMRSASEVAPHYGLGWFIDEDQGTVWHSGLVPGAEAIATMKPGEKKAAIVLINANSGIGIAYNYGLSSQLTAAALSQSPPPREAEWGMKLTYFSIILLPILFVVAMIWAVTHRTALAAKRASTAGRFSLWFPLLSTLAMAVVLIVVVPPLFGGSLATLRLYQPDFALAMMAASIMGPLWALLRLAFAYQAQLPRRDRKPPPPLPFGGPRDR